MDDKLIIAFFRVHVAGRVSSRCHEFPGSDRIWLELAVSSTFFTQILLDRLPALSSWKVESGSVRKLLKICGVA